MDTQPIVVFDGACGFCRCSVVWARHRVRPDVKFVAWQETDVEALGLTVDQCREALQWVSPDRHRRYSGHRAVARLLRDSPTWWRFVGRGIDLPGIRVLPWLGYAFVKANRSRLVKFCRQPIE